ISLPDAVDALILCAKNSELEGAVNVTAPQQSSNSEWTAALASALSRPALFPVPAWTLKLLYGEMAQAMLLEGQAVLPEKLLYAGFRFQHADLSSAFIDLLDDPVETPAASGI